MSGVLFFLGCSKAPFNSEDEESDRDSDHIGEDNDDDSIFDKYENVDADDDASPRHIPEAITKRPVSKRRHLKNKPSNLSLRLQQLEIQPVVSNNAPFSPSATSLASSMVSFTDSGASSIPLVASPIDYLGETGTPAYTSVKYDPKPACANNDSFPVNHEPPSPLSLTSIKDEDVSVSVESDPISLLSSSTSTMSSDSHELFDDLMPIIDAYSANLKLDANVFDRYLDLPLPLLEDPDKPQIPKVPLYDNVEDLLGEHYPWLTSGQYDYQLARLKHNRRELANLQDRLEQERLNRLHGLNNGNSKHKQVKPCIKRSRVKLH